MKLRALTAAALLLTLTACGTQPPTDTTPHKPKDPPSLYAAGAQPLPEKTKAKALKVTIPTIGVDSTLMDLALDTAGVLQAPTDYARAGWFTSGPTPGDPGPAVIAGHVDSKAGPAVFFRLRDLTPGTQLTVTRSDNTTATFTVDGVDRYPKNAFPTDAVYGPTPGSTLRLITCGGTFDSGKRSDEDNIVVYATRTA